MKFFTQKIALLVLASGLLIPTITKPETDWTKVGLIAGGAVAATGLIYGLIKYNTMTLEKAAAHLDKLTLRYTTKTETDESVIIRKSVNFGQNQSIGFWTHILYKDLRKTIRPYSLQYLAPLHRAEHIYRQDLKTIRTIKPFFSPESREAEKCAKLEDTLCTYINTILASSEFHEEARMLLFDGIHEILDGLAKNNK